MPKETHGTAAARARSRVPRSPAGKPEWLGGPLRAGDARTACQRPVPGAHPTQASPAAGAESAETMEAGQHLLACRAQAACDRGLVTAWLPGLPAAAAAAPGAHTRRAPLEQQDQQAMPPHQPPQTSHAKRAHLQRVLHVEFKGHLQLLQVLGQLRVLRRGRDTQDGGSRGKVRHAATAGGAAPRENARALVAGALCRRFRPAGPSAPPLPASRAQARRHHGAAVQGRAPPPHSAPQRSGRLGTETGSSGTPRSPARSRASRPLPAAAAPLTLPPTPPPPHLHVDVERALQPLVARIHHLLGQALQSLVNILRRSQAKPSKAKHKKASRWEPVAAGGS